MTSTADAVTSKYIPDVPVSKIALHPDNPRHDVGDVTDLAASIKDHGVLEPLVVVPYADVDRATGTGPGRAAGVLIAGHRRLAAAKKAKSKTVPVLMRYDLKTREEQVAAMVIENQHRADLSPVEEGEAYQLLLDITPSSTQGTVAAAVGMPKKRVSERVRLTKLGDAAKTAVHDGQITLTDALEVLAIEKRHPDLAEKATLAAGTPDFKYELTRAKQDANVLDRYDKVRDLATGLSTPVLTKTPGYADGDPRRVTIATHGIDVDQDLAGRAEAIEAIGRAHARCPGAAVYIPKTAPGSYDLGWYCTEFNDHHVPTEDQRRAERAEAATEWERQQAAREQERLAALSDEERAEEERAAAEKAAAEEAHAERKAALDAAQATRRAHFLDVINQGEPALAKVALFELCAPTTFVGGDFYGELNLEHDTVAKHVLGLDTDTGPTDIHDELRRLTTDQIALLLWFVNTQSFDDGLTLTRWSGSTLNVDPDYIRVLTDRYGYQWSTVEIEEFDLDEHGHVRTDDDVEAGDAA